MTEKQDKEKNQLPLTFQFLNEIAIIHQLAITRFEKDLPMGIKSNQFGILNHLVKLGDGRTFQRITDSFQVTKGAMTNNLNRLAEKKLITIKNDKKDGRVKRVYLTKLGIKIRNQAIKKASSSSVLQGNEFKQKEFEEALPFLSKVRQYLDTHRDS